jgi:hypothetical protein
MAWLSEMPGKYIGTVGHRRKYKIYVVLGKNYERMPSNKMVD